MPQSTRANPIPKTSQSSPIINQSQHTRVSSCKNLENCILALQNASASNPENKTIIEKVESLRDFMASKHPGGLTWLIQQELFREHIKPLYTILFHLQNNEELNKSLEQIADADAGKPNEAALTKELIEIKAKYEGLQLQNNHLIEQQKEAQDENKLLKAKAIEAEKWVQKIDEIEKKNRNELELQYSKKLEDISKLGNIIVSKENEAFEQFHQQLEQHRKYEMTNIEIMKKNTEATLTKLEAILTGIPDLLASMQTSLNTVEPGLKNLRDLIGGNTATNNSKPTKTSNKETTIFLNPVEKITKGDLSEI